MAASSASIDRLAPELLGLLAQARATSQSVDGPVARGRRDPRARVVGHAAVRPGLQGDDERVLDGLLGEVEVAEDADERRDGAALLGAEQSVDDLVGGGDRGAQPATASDVGAPANAGSFQSMTGRISTDPDFALGIRTAIAMASSRSAALTR